ncbi:Sec7 protein [Venustampulla echinocandica]|uniref:Sec7 protein n=1 Tax=Venustampulla echinocandica TaxID=2656787 RepID=A0A370TDM0_9HELO|nr:Sec7 protein [Venustampulla echinocandica]RDL32563.1 Sec7 protein [Venustampulla echinocandica]
MQSFENTPMSPTKRLGVSLNVDTGYKGKRIDNSPPETPAARDPRSASNRANMPPPSRALKQRETFLDDITPVDPASNKENDPENGPGHHRDSHDLSLSPRQVTRDSLVDHMLLSLDQFSFSHDEEAFGRQPALDQENMYSSFGDEESYQPTSNFAPRGGRPGHSYSYSSDYDNADDSSRYSGQLSRGRRSNSSSNFQPGLGRISSIRNEGGSRSFSSSTRGHVPIPPRGIHSRSGKGSKGSSANSFDLGYAQVTSSQRWAHGLAGRSSSFDYGRERQTMTAQSDGLPRQNAPVFTPYDYDAAPTPTVPGGPRRPRPVSPILLPQKEAVIMDPAPPKLEHKRSTKSSKSAFRGKTAGSMASRVDYGLNDNSRELPPLPAFIREPAPSPTVAYEKLKDTSQPSSTIPQPAKDRPGFFRRVFGSSRSNPPPSAPEPPRSHGSTTSTDTANRPGSKTHHIATQMKSQHVPPPREPPPPPKDHGHVLNKKPSSFFRRRKKSVSEPPVPGPLQPTPPILLQSELPLPSPVSSLRKVMNPYLRTPARIPSEPYVQESSIDRQMNSSPEPIDRSTRGFSPDYEPDKSATIRTVRPESKDATDGIPSSSGSAHRPFLSSLSAGPTGGDGTFLQDASDNDPDAHSNNSKSALVGREGLESGWHVKHTSPVTPIPVTSAVARDMALVAEYERIHSKRSPTGTKFDLAKSSTLESSQSQTDAKSSQKGSTTGKDEEWVMLTPTKSPQQLEKGDREWSEPDDEGPRDSNHKLPKGEQPSRTNSGSTDTIYKSATSLPIVQIEGEVQVDASGPQLLTEAEAVMPLDEPTPIDPKAPTEDDRERAKKIYDGNEDFIQKEKAAAWMGEEGALRSRVLTAYLELYEFSNLNILAALRIMCGRLVLKAESQQVDRILDTFAKRWCQCNPNHGFKVTDVVHTICYSILLLNTDLHLADIDQKMTRSQFVKNTMPTIRKSVAESAPDAFEARPTVLPGKNSTFGPDSSKQPGDSDLKPERGSIEVERPSWRSSFKPPVRAGSEGNGVSPTPLDYDTPVDDCGPLVKAPFHGTLRTWEVQVEIVLKDFYNSIRNDRLPLFGAPIERPQLHAPSTNSLTVFASGVLRRTPSVLSKAPSESLSYARGRTAETVRVGNGKWANKNRSRPRLYPGSGVGSSRTSLDDQSSMWSPSVSSSTWSKYSLGKTQTSMSVDSFGSNWPQGDYQQSIGFANALSQAIIREETIGSAGSNGSDQEPRVAPLLEDESLELHGAPWAKEGILKHKHHLESLDKKAKDRNWNEVFAVVEKGYLSLFSFSSKSMRNKSKGKAAGAVVGGGNWQENAQSLGSFLLRQTIASSLPPPGYSKARPHVWALSLPTGAVHLFQVGTPDIVKEFVSTANYWSARLSNHPLVGGISNIEYGWSDAIVNNALVAAINDSTTSRPSTSGARPSLQSSLRSSIDQSPLGGGVRSRLPGDRITISDWTPPTQSMRASNLMEADQLQTLQTYVAGIEEELQKHNQLRNPMLLAFTPRHPNSQKAMANWEKKSSYLLREIVKFRTYIDCLLAAEAAKQRIYAERAAEKALTEDAAGSDDDDDEGDTTLRPE